MAINEAAITASATAASAGGQIALGGINGHKNRELAREQMRFNAEQAEKANKYNAEQAAISRDWQESFYKNYQSPEAMMEQKIAAGYNPYGEFGNPQSPVSAPSYSPAEVPNDNSFSTAANANNTETQQLMQGLQNLSSVYRELMSLRQIKAETESIESDNQLKQQQYRLDSFQERVMKMPLGEGDLLGFDHYGKGSKWYTDFQARNGRDPEFGDLHWQAYFKQIARDLNRRNGLGSLNAQDPVMSAFREWVSGSGADVGENIDFTDPDGYINRLWRGASNQAYLDEKDKGEMMNKLLYQLVSGQFDAKNQFERSAVDSFVKTFKKNRMINGMPEDSSSMLNSILLLLYHQDPEFIKTHVGKLSKVLDDIMTRGETQFDGPLSSITDLISSDMSDMLEQVYRGMLKGSKAAHIIGRGVKGDVKKLFGR